MPNKVYFGLSKVHFAFFSPEGTSTDPQYETPIAVEGAVRLTPTTVGETTTFYADDRPYVTITANNGYTFELEMAAIPDAIKARVFGWKVDENGALIEITDGVAERFALLAEMKGDARARRFVYYDATLARGAKEAATKGESVEIVGETFTGTATPVVVDGLSMTRADIERDATKPGAVAAYDAFFSEVYLPTFAVTPGGA